MKSFKNQQASRIFCTLASLAALTALTSCASTKISLTEYQPVAIMTVYGNRSVPWHADESPSSEYKVAQTEDGVLTGLLNRAIDRDDPETTLAQERLNSASSILTESLEKSGISVISGDALKNTKTYSTGFKAFLNYMDSKLPAEGYQVISSSSSKLNKMMASETGANLMLYVSFRFEKQKVLKGVHVEGVAARVDLSIYGAGADGKTLVNSTYTAISPDYVPYKNNSWDKERLCALFELTAQNAVDQFIMDLTEPESNQEEVDTEILYVAVPKP